MHQRKATQYFVTACQVESFFSSSAAMARMLSGMPSVRAFSTELMLFDPALPSPSRLACSTCSTSSIFSSSLNSGPSRAWVVIVAGGAAVGVGEGEGVSRVGG